MGTSDWTFKNSYFLALMSLGYIVGEIAHFLINTSSRAVAQDIQYGDQACFRNTTALIANESSALDCIDFKDQSECIKHDHCSWSYNGAGLEYQLLAGPSFIAVFTICCVIIGITSDNFVKFGRHRILAIGFLLFSVSCFLMGLSTAYWQLVILRMGIAAGESVCRPVSGSLIADIFGPSTRGLANGILSWGVYYGYGLAFVIGIYVTQADILSYGWRASYILPALPGLVLAFLLLFTVSDPKKQDDDTTFEAVQDSDESQERQSNSSSRGFVAYLEILARSFCNPTTILLLLGACFRHTAGYCWAYNTRLFFQTYYPTFDHVGLWILGCSIGGGSFGVFFGGWMSDKIVSRLGIHSRLWVLGGFTLCSVPFAMGTLHFPPPYAFVSLILYYFCAETWFAILFTVIVELCAPEVKSASIGLFLFIMNNIGGNLPVIVDPLSKAMGYKEAIYFIWPGCVAISGVVFLISSVPLWLQARRNVL